MLGVDHQRRLGEQRLAVVPHPAPADAGARAGVVMPVESDEDHRAAALRLRHLGVVLGQADDGGDAAGIVACGVEPAVAMRDEVDRLVGAPLSVPQTSAVLRFGTICTSSDALTRAACPAGKAAIRSRTA